MKLLSTKTFHTLRAFIAQWRRFSQSPLDDNTRGCKYDGTKGGGGGDDGGEDRSREEEEDR